ncbi:HAD-IA family hydrolase [Prochlorococcus sp. MIT 1300]|uniref:HAD family hydrolase n=1 Tax=Prochlorococcus sp. MIT 1300 TaxID=3096218 RepID=UPI002A74E545|nr:HAD-IA family hydrolase [Prochlorococcus sp. MIT 1300]
MPHLFLKGIPLGSFKGILFDKDGTLSNSEADLLITAKTRIDQATLLLSSEGEKPETIEKIKHYLENAYGLNNDHLNPGGIIAVASREQNLISTATVFCLLGKTWPESQLMANKVFSLTDKLKGESTPQIIQRKLLPGVLKLLNNLRNAGCICAIISNDSSSGIRDFIDSNKLKIDHYWSAEHVPPKPDPGAVKGLCNLIGLKPSECVLVGDADSDLTMSRQAGIGLTMGYVAGWNEPPFLSSHQKLIHHWDELTVKANLKVLDTA